MTTFLENHMDERLKREHCVGILLEEICAVMAEDMRDESHAMPPVTEGFRRLDRPAVLRILVRTKPGYRPDMAGFVTQYRPDLGDYVNECLCGITRQPA